MPPYTPGHPPLTIPAQTATRPAPVFSVQPPGPVTEPREITVTSTQIQYSQEVLLNFNGLLWPHVSTATLVPSHPVYVPPSGWA